MVTQVADPFGRTALFEYDGNRNLVKITGIGGYWSSLSYDEDVYLTEIASDLGAWQFYIEPTDDDKSATDRYPAPGEGMWENYRITITDPLGGKEEYFYYGGVGTIGDWDTWYTSPRDYIPWQSEEMNNFTFDTTKTIYYFDHKGGVLDNTTLSPHGQIMGIRYPAGNTITYTYDLSTGERTSVSDSAGNTILYTYNDMGRVTSVTDAKGTKTDFSYAANKIDLTQITNGLGTVSMTYNTQHDILSVTDRLNTTTAFSYNAKGQRTSVTEAQGVLDRVTNYSYDPTTSKLLQILQGSNALSSYTYDAVGRVKTSTDATGLTLSYAYNDLNYLTRIDYPDGKFSEKTYGSCCPGMITSETDRSGKTTTYFYDELKRRVKTLHPDSTITQAKYDANGNLITLLDSNSNATRFSYDMNDRLIKNTYADGKDEKFIYNSLGQLEQQLNGRGIAANYAYDANYNLLSVAYANDDTPGVTYQYDVYNRLIQHHDGIGLTAYSYDANSRILSVDGPWDNDTLTYQYDVLGRRTGVTPQSGTALAYTYDSLNRLTQIQGGSRAYSYAYNGMNPLVQMLTRPNNSSTVYLYDTLNRLTSIANKTSTDALLT
ncbi:MAG: RHS repeat protein [Candidatus Electrothrix sp. AR1]|nr:RHS repeat protein [Candidatus Electrothrix sp. AR1]